ncbi:Type IV leader peptidase family protein [Aquisphaera giovannonii]|uniref:Type IV leader peptidase family protein n=1 Tax=Aquisphaera giovannonii TaxID=406548 RepID=A0A5B9W154_9BACT|nr:A24 family peptidase [Aquisphaera giovannonii]QEH34306.1 Type IV leader peptidase family protein [Aquisphaera giovannonii]
MTVVPAVAWFVSAVLVVAAIIDGRQLRVPNWLTFPLLFAGLGFAAGTGGAWGLGWSLAGAVVGLLCLLPLNLIGGMGEGDVKLMMGMGAWVGAYHTLMAFAGTVLAGGVLGVAMIAASGEWIRHLAMMQVIGHEILAIRNPDVLSERAARRKPSMRLLPYGIPIALGSITYFACWGLLGSW